MKYQWYIINVKCGFEKKALISIQNNAYRKNAVYFFKSFIIPTAIISKINKNKIIEIEKILFPSYLIVKTQMNNITWNIVQSSSYVIIFLIYNDETHSISNIEMNNIYQIIEASKIINETLNNFEIGDNIKIIDGSFINFYGTVLEVINQKKRIRISVYILSREISLELSFNQIQKIN